MKYMLTAAYFSILIFILIHIFGYRLSFLDVIPRSVWLSFASGISVSYIIMDIMPKLAEGQRIVDAAGIIKIGENHVYIIVLLGLSAFYGLEQIANKSKEDKSGKYPGKNSLFKIHMLFFSIYNAIIGYTLLNLSIKTVKNIALFTIAIGLHFFINDFGLNKKHDVLYVNKGRYILSAAILIGFAISIFYKLPPHAVVILLAFISGGAIINVIKEELPEERKSRFWAFFTGAIVYAMLLLEFR